MKLYLVQHGLNLTEDVDPKKGLSPKGKEQTSQMAEFIKGKGVEVNVIWHSQKERSIQTAQIFSEYISGAKTVERDDLNPNDPVDKFTHEIQALEKDLLIVGHLPFLQKLASLLLSGSQDYDFVSFKNSGVVCLEYTDRWKLLWIIVPGLT